jgi:hypothetical protein
MNSPDLFTDKLENSLTAAFSWWEKRRMVFNLTVGLTGLFSFVVVGRFYVHDLVVIIIYGVIANLFYCLGFYSEVAAKHYFKGRFDFSERRNNLFTLGLLVSIGVTLLMGIIPYLIN